MGCSFVIPARNEELHLDACLRSLKGQSTISENPLKLQLIVVDNASTDRTVEIASQHEATIVNVPPGNPGRARNAGVKHACHEYIAFIDADCVLPENWFVSTRNTLKQPQVVAVGCPQAGTPRDAPWVERVWVNTIIPAASANTKRVTWLPAFNLLLKRADFLAVGGFDESLETCEDSDLSYRLGQTGKLVCNAATPVRHLGESRTLAEFFQREMWRSRGNLASARKRGTLHKEFFSLFAPIFFTCVAITLPFATILAVTTSTLAIEAVVAAWLCTLCIPMGISFKKGGTKEWLQRCVLIAVYLLARGAGLLVSGNRVERRSSDRGEQRNEADA
ncbi:glycosyltransferase [bacterium]|nr:glycosyltransferase [bacterium]